MLGKCQMSNDDVMQRNLQMLPCPTPVKMSHALIEAQKRPSQDCVTLGP